MRGQLQQEILDMLARGSSLEDACDRICEHAERLAAAVICSIVTVDREGLLHPLAGPTISKTYSDALDGIPIGPDVGSCGTAAHFRRPIAVTDIFADPLWIPYRPLADILAKEHGVKACWSSPILRSDGRVLGAFGFYYKDNRGPTPEERMIVAECLDLCSLVLEREEVRRIIKGLPFSTASRASAIAPTFSRRSRLPSSVPMPLFRFCSSISIISAGSMTLSAMRPATD
jgi:GAF domain-containing protein